jgi:hypothetical protein
MFLFKKKWLPLSSDSTRRKHKRILYNFPVDLIVGPKHFERFSRTLSAGGLYLAASQTLATETVVDLRIGTEGPKNYIRALGSVVYAHTGEGMGIKFIELSREDRDQIQALIEKGWWQEI